MLVELKEFETVSFDPKKVSRVSLSHGKISICFENGRPMTKHIDDESAANELYQ